MIQAFEQLQNEVKNISINSQKLQTIINNYTLFYVSEPIIEKNQNQQIFNNIKKSKIIIINKYNNETKGSNEEFFIIGFERTILLIDNQNSFSYLNNLFPIDIKICFFNDAKNYFIQHTNIQFQEINNNCDFKEINCLTNHMASNKYNINDSISNMWKFITKSISLYLINKAYNKAQTNRIRSYIQNKDNLRKTKFSEILTIKENDFIHLRDIKSGSKFISVLIYHIENEELYVVKNPYGTYDSSKYIIQETNNYLQLNHPLIPKLIGKTENNYIVIEFIDGQTLNQIVPSLNYNQLVNVILQII